MSQKRELSITLSAGLERSVDQKLAEIRQSDKAGEIVASLAPHDLLTLFSHADDEQRADLLAVAGKEQADLLVDLACWPTDRPNLLRVEETFKSLVMSGLGGATRAVDMIEPELLTLLLKQNVIIHLLENRNDEVPVKEDSEVISFPDGLYYLEIPESLAVTDFQRAIFQAFMARPFEKYQTELECIRHDLVSDLEESAFKWRTSRLADYGFVPREEARAILSPRSADEVRELADSTDSFIPPADQPLPMVYRENFEGSDFLTGIIEQMNASKDPNLSTAAERIYVALTATTGTFITATGIDIGDVGAVAGGVRQVRSLLSLGLEECASGGLAEGVRLAAALEPAFFVQVGLGLLYPLQKRSQSILGTPDLAIEGRPGQVFDPAHHHTLMSLSGDVPQYYAPALTSAKPLFDLVEPLKKEVLPLSSLCELQQVEKILEETEVLAAVLFEGLGCTAPLPAETQSSVLVLTALANTAFDRAPNPKPLTAAEAVAFQEQVKAEPVERFIEGAVTTLAEALSIKSEGPMDPTEESDPKRRLVLRLIQIGHTRLLAVAPESALVIA